MVAYFAALFGLIGLSGCTPKQEAAVAPATARKATIVFVDGIVTVNGAAIEIGARLPDRSVIETGPGAVCEIIFGDRNAVRVSQNAVATLDFSQPVLNVDLKKGGVTSVLKKLDKLVGKDSFVIRTETAVAGVRGTSFCVWADATSMYVCACNGTVRTIDGKGSNEQTLESAHHVARLYAAKDGAISVDPAGIEHHSDDSVQSLAARIGVVVDWDVVDK